MKTNYLIVTVVFHELKYFLYLTLYETLIPKNKRINH